MNPHDLSNGKCPKTGKPFKKEIVEIIRRALPGDHIRIKCPHCGEEHFHIPPIPKFERGKIKRKVTRKAPGVLWTFLKNNENP